MTTMTPHGRSRYAKGCRCGVCREANRTYQRRYRRAKIVRPVPDAETEHQDPAQATPGPVATAITAELAGLPAAASRPALCAIALVLAEGLDRDDAVPQYAALAHRLVGVLDEIRKHSPKRGRLTAVRSMTPNTATPRP